MSTITEMAEVHAARIAERDAKIASQAAEIEAYKHEAEVYREIKIEYEILLARSQREAAEIERLRGVLSIIANAVMPAFVEGKGQTYAEQVHRHHTSLRQIARAALQPKEGNQ